MLIFIQITLITLFSMVSPVVLANTVGANTVGANTVEANHNLELLVIYSPECPRCHEWMDEVYPSYDSYGQSVGQKRPSIRLLSLKKKSDVDWINQHLETVLFTPTFVLWDTDQEFYRFRGYGSQDGFFKELNLALRKTDKSLAEKQ